LFPNQANYLILKDHFVVSTNLPMSREFPGVAIKERFVGGDQSVSTICVF
jgi:hypothetical protein